VQPVSDDLDERAALLDCLQYQRSSVLAIVNGMTEAAWHTSVVPSGWTTAGFVEHLGGAEYHWFHEVVAGLADEELLGDEEREPYNPLAAFTSNRPSVEILSSYIEQCRFSDEVLAQTTLSAKALGRHTPDAEIPSVREVVLHMIEETAAHSGHLEIARELLDGQIRLGLR
jgi:hypothetical protein